MKMLLVPVLALALAGGVATTAQAGKGVRDNPDGSPRAGQDPANQPAPSSLTIVARKGKPSDVQDPGVNTGKTKPAKGLRGERKPVKAADILQESSARGGCTAGYGSGSVCLPVVPPSAAAHAGHGMTIRWTCAEARLTLPQGIEVTGTDQLKLDSNADRVACGPGDK